MDLIRAFVFQNEGEVSVTVHLFLLLSVTKHILQEEILLLIAMSHYVSLNTSEPNV